MIIEERLFHIKHRLVATEIFNVSLNFEDVMLILYEASKELHWSVAKHNVLRGEFIFATPKTYRCSGEVIFIKVEMDGKDEKENEISKVSIMSRPRRSSTLFDFKKNLYNVTQLKELFDEHIYLEEEEARDNDESHSNSHLPGELLTKSEPKLI